MSGGFEAAKPARRRPLDARVRRWARKPTPQGRAELGGQRAQHVRVHGLRGATSKPREYLGESRTVPSRRRAAHTELRGVRVGKVPCGHSGRPMRADWWKAPGRPLTAEGRTAQ